MAHSTQRLTAALDGRYRIERELGAGGMATVYLAHYLKHDREVAHRAGWRVAERGGAELDGRSRA